MSTNLFRSDRGQELASEVSLAVLEYVLAAEPKSAFMLMSVCKAFRDLLREYECSISKRLVDRTADRHLNADAKILRASTPHPRPIVRDSYRWVLEIRMRRQVTEAILDSLKAAKLISPGAVDSGGETQPNTQELEKRHRWFWQEGIALLYQLSDVIAGRPKHAQRDEQISFLESLPSCDLAILICLAKMLRIAYHGRLQTQAATVQPLAFGLAQESICVFEDKLLREPPSFTCHVLGGSGGRDSMQAWTWTWTTTERRKIDVWVASILHEGRQEMLRYERGEDATTPGMQSALTKLFAARLQRGVLYSWEKAWALVEERLAFCTDTDTDAGAGAGPLCLPTPGSSQSTS